MAFDPVTGERHRESPDAHGSGHPDRALKRVT